MQPSGVDAAIRELEQEVKRVQEAIAMLRRIQTQRGSRVGAAGRKVGYPRRRGEEFPRLPKSVGPRFGPKKAASRSPALRVSGFYNRDTIDNSSHSMPSGAIVSEPNRLCN
jgi:hypothetical protein